MSRERLSSKDEKETSRLEAFSDGVFAIAITLLILDVKTPDTLLDDSGLWRALLDQWPTFLALGTSFFSVGIIWLNHHRLFTHIQRTNTVLIILNLLLLFMVVLIPIPTALLAKYIDQPNQHTAAIVYNGTLFLLACCINGLWRYASYQSRLFGKEIDHHAVKAIHRQYSLGPLLYAVAFVVAWFNSPVSIVLQLLLAFFFALPGIPQRIPRQKSKEKSQPPSALKPLQQAILPNE